MRIFKKNRLQSMASGGGAVALCLAFSLSANAQTAASSSSNPEFWESKAPAPGTPMFLKDCLQSTSSRERDRALCFSMALAVHAQTWAPAEATFHAQAVAPLSPPSLTRDSDQIDDELLDAVVPVFTMEQLGDARNKLQGYRVQIFKDGRASYHGFREVKRLGEVRFLIAPEQVQRIQAEPTKYKFLNVPNDVYSRSSPPSWLFTMRTGTATKAVRARGADFVLIWRKIVEDEVRSARWRCPYSDGDGEEKCKFFESIANERIEHFISHDLTTFLETYK